VGENQVWAEGEIWPKRRFALFVFFLLNFFHIFNSYFNFKPDLTFCLNFRFQLSIYNSNGNIDSTIFNIFYFPPFSHFRSNNSLLQFLFLFSIFHL
jgi:hypothetical protein